MKKRDKDAKANAVCFSDLCTRFDEIWKQRKKQADKATAKQMLNHLISEGTKNYFGVNYSYYQMLRIIVPEIDHSRPQYGMKEANIAAAWADALGLTKGSAAYNKLHEYQDPIIAGHNAAGDISMVVYEVMKERCPDGGSNITLGELNKWLDELAEVKKIEVGKSGNRNTKHQLRVDWVDNLISHNLSPLEHKWIVRIILHKLELGFGHRQLLDHYHDWAMKLFNANSSLKELCLKLCDPKWINEQKQLYNAKIREEQLNCIREIVPIPMEEIRLNFSISPMLAKRTTYQELLDDIYKPYESLKTKLESNSDNILGLNFRKSLTFRFPAFVCEAKSDGERMLAHINRGTVTLQSRQCNWYSQQYSPVIAPAIRRAISKYDVDVVFDGEMISWDDENQEKIEFGFNRAVAKARRIYCQENDMIDQRDINLHCNDDDTKIAPDSNFNNDKADYSGENCWLKYVVFDILYIDGPDAAKLLNIVNTAIDPSSIRHGNKFNNTGSIINIDLYQRKAILHELLEPQENEVEFIPSYVIRPNGSMWNTSDYFKTQDTFMEHGHSVIILDSMSSFVGNEIPNIDEIDIVRCNQSSDKQIHEDRANALEDLFKSMVEHHLEEGIVVKDLSAPYYLGQKSRNLGFWRKLKADYEASGHASDLDVLILGGYYATGMSRSGLINQFLVGVIDSESSGYKPTYLSLATVNGGGTSMVNLEKILKHTGYEKGSQYEASDFGRWFKLNKDRKELPDFISKRSFQRSQHGDNQGWKVSCQSYPDLWINPEDSLVITLNAYEIVHSETYSSGLSLRFPRIRKIRLEDIDGYKMVNEVESRESLYEIYEKQCEQAHDRDFSESENRFLRSDAARIGTKRKRTANTYLNQSVNFSNIQATSKALSGLTFTVYEGNYDLNQDFVELGENEGWIGDVYEIDSRNDIMKFIRQNGGTCACVHCNENDYVLGGQSDDMRILIHKRAVASDNVSSSTSSTEYGNVLKWTFVFSIVSKWLERLKEDYTLDEIRSLVLDENQCIKKAYPDLLARTGEHKI